MTALQYLLFKDNVKVLSPKHEGYLVVINLWAFEWIIIYAKYQSQDNLQATSSAAYCQSDHLRGINLSIHLKRILRVYASQSIPSCHIVSNKISLLSKWFRIHRLSFKIGICWLNDIMQSFMDTCPVALTEQLNLPVCTLTIRNIHRFKPIGQLKSNYHIIYQSTSINETNDIRLWSWR